MDHSTLSSVTSSNITTTSTIITSTPASSKSATVIVDPSSSDEKSCVISALYSSTPSASSDPHHTPKRVSSSTLSSPVLTPPTGKIFSRNCNGTSEWRIFFLITKAANFFPSIHVWAIKLKIWKNVSGEKTRRNDKRHRHE